MRTFLKSEHGSDLIEYAMLLGCIALAATATLISMMSNLEALWQVASSRLAAP